MKKLLLVLPMLLASCVVSDAEKATFEAIAPEYRNYVEKDAALDADQKARRFRLLDEWGNRLNATPAAAPAAKPVSVVDDEHRDRWHVFQPGKASPVVPGQGGVG